MQPVELPYWMEVVRAMGTAVAAIAALLITRHYSKRQAETAAAALTTAKNKLKSDLFDRRLKVYSAIVETLECTVNGSCTREQSQTFINAMLESEFLFNSEISDYLIGTLRPLMEAVLRESVERKKSSDAPSDDDGLDGADEIPDTLDVARKRLQPHFMVVREKLRPFLTLSHD